MGGRNGSAAQFTAGQHQGELARQTALKLLDGQGRRVSRRHDTSRSPQKGRWDFRWALRAIRRRQIQIHRLHRLNQQPAPRGLFLWGCNVPDIPSCRQGDAYRPLFRRSCFAPRVEVEPRLHPAPQRRFPASLDHKRPSRSGCRPHRRRSTEQRAIESPYLLTRRKHAEQESACE